jgi:hypothetical protein
MRIKALSLYQPHADLVALGFKKIETRTWSLSYRGPILICAAKRFDKMVKKDIEFYKDELQCQQNLKRETALLPSNYEPRFGVAVAVARLYDCRPLVEVNFV